MVPLLVMLLLSMLRIRVKLLAGLLAFAAAGSGQEFRPQIPKVWDEAALADFEVPLAKRDRSPGTWVPANTMP